MTEEMARIIKLHKRWADGHTIIWIGFVLMLLTGVQIFLEYTPVEPTDRIAILVLLAALVIVATTRQAVGIAIARVHMIHKGIDLER